MAEAAGLATLRWVVSPLIKILIEKALDLLGTDINEKNSKLQAIVIPQLSQAIEKAEMLANKERVMYWLQRLKDAYYEAEDAIDLFEYDLLEQKARENRLTTTEKIMNKSRTFLYPKKSMLKNRIDKLIEIATEANQFHDFVKQEEHGSSNDHYRGTSSDPPARVFGCDEDRDRVVGLLAEDPSSSDPGPGTRKAIPIIAIIGRSGIGKTALAQHVFEQEQKHFSLSVWVHVPRAFKAHDVIKDIIHNIQAKEGTSHVGNYESSISLSVLQTQLQNMLGSKKFFLVLDDFWSDHTTEFRNQWEDFLKSLRNCSPDSRILLTTQSNETPKQTSLLDLAELKPYYLKDLEGEEFLKLFMHHANCSLRSVEFGKIGREIASKLKGDPGAAKVVGFNLKKKSVEDWMRVVQKDWLGDEMKARIWSYEQLPAHLQRCFAFFSLFPRGSRFPIPLLIDFWIAEGLVKRDKKERVEDIGIRYMQELFSRFFLEQHPNELDKVYLHDLFYDLAERVGGDDFITIEYTNSKEFPLDDRELENIRHISLPANMVIDLKDKLCLMKNLYTICVHNPNTLIPNEELTDILKNSRKLRVLYLAMCFDDLPDSFDSVKHLRLLNIGRSQPLQNLPDSICKLYHLQTLTVPTCESLPKNFCELLSLRYFSAGSNTTPPICDVGRLTCLQRLTNFLVKNESGHELHQLENLNDLHGKLCIKGLENVANIEDAAKAGIRKKRHLEELEFEWDSNERVIDDFQLLDTLQPHPDISHLTITRYRGNRLPTWLLQPNSLKYLTSLRLLECNEVDEISFVEEPLPNCRFLSLRRLTKLKELPPFPPNLTSLEIVGIPQLSFFSKNHQCVKESILQALDQIMVHLKSNGIKLPKNVRSVVKNFIQFTNERWEAQSKDLQNGNIFSEIEPNKEYSQDELLDAWVMAMCCHLNTMFMNGKEESKVVLPSSLTSLWIGSCSIMNDALSTCLKSLVFLSELQLSDIQTITALPPEEVLSLLKNLSSLTIVKCLLLCSLGGIGALTSLTKLKLDICISLSESNEPLPSSLEKLEFWGCINVEIILAKSHFPALLFLLIINIGEFQKGVLHVGHLSSLEELILSDCSRLEGLNSLASVHTMELTENYLASPVDKYTSPLQGVAVTNPLQLKLLLSDETISSIKHLTICLFDGDLADEVFHSLTSIIEMRFVKCKIRHLPPNMNNLPSLQYVDLVDCPNLRELEDLPQNLCQLRIEDCPSLVENFKKGGPNYQVRFWEGCTIVTFLTEEEGNQFKL